MINAATIGKVVFWLFVIPLFLVVIVFAISNNSLVEVSLWPVLTDAVLFPLYGVVLIGIFAGFVLGAVVAWLQGGGSRQRARRLRREVAQEQLDAKALRERLVRLEAAEKEATIPPAPAANTGVAVTAQATH